MRSTTESLTVVAKRNDLSSKSLMIEELIEELVRKQLREGHSARISTDAGMSVGAEQ